MRPPRRRPLALAAALLAALLALPARSEGDGARPIVAVVAANAGTETTDFVVPYGVLAASGAVDVVAVSTEPGPVTLMPALTVELDETIASFARRAPAGADVVVVPAVHGADDPTLIAWVRAQAERGARIVAVCDGVWVVARAGLLEGRTATGHWYSLDDLERDFPETRWVRDRRWVRDGPVVTTAGVTASLPASLALLEELAGRDAAARVARELGVARWDDAHDGAAFALDARHVATVARNWLAFWRHETVGVPIAGGVDEVALALTADALGRTYRTTVRTVAPSSAPVVTRRGLRVVPDVADGTPEAAALRLREPLPEVAPAAALDATLATLAKRHDASTARLVALQLEYPWRPPGS